MPNELITGIVVLAIGGAGTIAYQHPESYRFPGLLMLGLAIVAGAYLTGYQIAISNAGEIVKVHGSKPPMIMQLDQAALKRGQVNLFIILGTIINLVLLSLPLWLKKESDR